MLLGTGLLLNHSASLALNKRFIGQDWLLDWYDIEAPKPFTAFAVGAHWFTQIGNRVYRDGEELLYSAAPLLGAITEQQTTVLAFSDHLALIAADGIVVDTIDSADGLALPVHRLGRLDNGRLVTDSPAGLHHLEIDSLSLSLLAETVRPAWSTASTLPDELSTILDDKFRGRGLSAQRVLLDLHTGRIGGRFGVLVIDGAAIAMVGLAISGVWLWLKHRRINRRARRQRPDL
jgi:hypothetical protein